MLKLPWYTPLMYIWISEDDIPGPAEALTYAQFAPGANVKSSPGPKLVMAVAVHAGVSAANAAGARTTPVATSLRTVLTVNMDLRVCASP